MRSNAIPAFLLGAGASHEAQVPLSRDLTRLLLESLSSSDQFTREASALSFVVGAIIHHDSRAGQRPDVLPDIERVASAVELLAARSELEVVPFVSSWDASVEALEQRSPHTPHFIEGELSAALHGRKTGSPHRLVNNLVLQAIKGRSVTPSHFDQELRRSIGEPDQGRLVRALVRLIDSRSASLAYPAFDQLLQALVHGVVQELCKAPASAFDYLSPIANIAVAHADQPTVVATLNYDLSVEAMAERIGCPVDRAITGWSTSGHLSQPAHGLYLLKLHGSVDWARTEAGGPLPTSAMDVVDPNSLDPFRPAPFLVFGQREKLRAGGPFLQLLEEFRSRLNATNHLAIVGYSFRDAHINELISRWFNASTQRRIVVVDPFFPGTSEMLEREDFRSRLLDATAPGDDGRNRVHIARIDASLFLSQLDVSHPLKSLASLFEQV